MAKVKVGMTGKEMRPMFQKGKKSMGKKKMMMKEDDMDMEESKGKKKGGKKLTSKKAKKILREGKAKGKPLSGKQRGYFGLIASGKTPTKSK